MENSYQMDTDPSLFVHFKLSDEDEHCCVDDLRCVDLLANMVLAVTGRHYSLVAWR